MRILTFILAGVLVAPLAFADDGIPPCMARGREIPVDNAQVVQWESSTPNQFLARAHVEGQIVQIFSNIHGHNHFAIQVGNSETLEVVYNESFGALPNLAVGMTVEACGDYITSNAQAGPYPASPSGAIIHWVHLNPRHHGHDSGFLIIDGYLYGQDPNGDGA